MLSIFVVLKIRDHPQIIICQIHSFIQDLYSRFKFLSVETLKLSRVLSASKFLSTKITDFVLLSLFFHEYPCISVDRISCQPYFGTQQSLYLGFIFRFKLVQPCQDRKALDRNAIDPVNDRGRQGIMKFYRTCL